MNSSRPWQMASTLIQWLSEEKNVTRKAETKEGKSWEMLTKTFQRPFDSYSTCVSYHMFYTEFHDSKIIYFRSQTCIFTAIINCGPKTGCVSFEFPVEMYFFCFHCISFFFYCMCIHAMLRSSLGWVVTILCVLPKVETVIHVFPFCICLSLEYT